MARDNPDDIVITGIGIISPVGIGAQSVREALHSGRSGIGLVQSFDTSLLPVCMAAYVSNFDPRQYVRPRKNLKLMSRDIQLGVAAAEMACHDAKLAPGSVPRERLGVVFGADMMRHELSEIEAAYRVSIQDRKFRLDRWPTFGYHEINPLGLLKVLPNMLSSHISIAHDACGPDNTITTREVSSLLAMAESAEILRRGAADVMISGGASSRLHPLDITRFAIGGTLSQRYDQPASAVRPFDAERDGQVLGEGAGAVVLETRRHAAARKAPVRAHLLGWSCSFETGRDGRSLSGSAVGRAVQCSLQRAGIEPRDVGHVNAHGLSTIDDDRIEAQAIRGIFPNTPVTAPKSFFGNLGAATGAAELIVSLIALEHDHIPPTLNYRRPDPQCPLHVVGGGPLKAKSPTFICLNHTAQGQAAAVVVRV